MDNKEKAQYLRELVERVCELFGEDLDFTRQYVDDVLKENKFKLDEAISCFEDLKSQKCVVVKREEFG